MEKKINTYLLVFAILATSFTLISSICTAQSQDVSKAPAKPVIKAEEIATQQIKDLKEGVLFVRLQTRQKSIDAMRKAGQNELADKKQAEQLELNKCIISAFRKEFVFCKVYFFYSDDSKNILDKNFTQIVFVNDSAIRDENIKIETPNKFFIAEFGTSSQDTASYYSHTAYEPDGNFSSGPVQVYYGGSNTGAHGLKIMSDSFVQLRKPFPYFVKSPFFKRKSFIPATTVEKMNLNLFKFYESVVN